MTFHPALEIPVTTIAVYLISYFNNKKCLTEIKLFLFNSNISDKSLQKISQSIKKRPKVYQKNMLKISQVC